MATRRSPSKEAEVQLDLFGTTATATATATATTTATATATATATTTTTTTTTAMAAVLPHVDPGDVTLANALPPWILLGTSSWTFPGWGGLVYEGEPSQAALVREGLRAYARHPLFRCAGLDRSHYSPLSERELSAYAAQLPAAYPVVSKVWDGITTRVFPLHPRFGPRAGQLNPQFLDPVLTKEAVIDVHAASFVEHTGPFVFELPRFHRTTASDAEDFARRVDTLLGALPSRFQYAFELRLPSLLTPRYFDVLRAHGAAHVFNFWSAMPSLREQLALAGGFTAPFAVMRLLLPPGRTYESERDRFHPFDAIVEAQPTMREDVVALAEAFDAIGGQSLYILVNNKAEGSAPLTVRALARLLSERLHSATASSGAPPPAGPRPA